MATGRRTIKAAETGKSGSCHILLYTCAQQLLGHGRLDTTQIYTEVGIKALREVCRTHPANQGHPHHRGR